MFRLYCALFHLSIYLSIYLPHFSVSLHSAHVCNHLPPLSYFGAYWAWYRGYASDHEVGAHHVRPVGSVGLCITQHMVLVIYRCSAVDYTVF